MFPRHCPVCDAIVTPCGNLICESCHNQMRYLGNVFCKKCGKKLKNAQDEYCYDCIRKTHLFDQGRALYEYESIRVGLYRLKYGGRKEYSEFFAMEISLFFRAQIKEWHADALVPVPLHRSRERKRGYNQAQLLAEHMGKQLGIPVCSNLIKRRKRTIPQKKLTLPQRQNNLKKAFKLCRNDVKLRTIIIIDDIFTTGSTMDAMALEFKHAGVENVYFITLAIGEGF